MYYSFLDLTNLSILIMNYLINTVQISSIHQVLAQQFSETMMYPLNKFLQADLEGQFVVNLLLYFCHKGERFE